jgi:hypothetical protein
MTRTLIVIAILGSLGLSAYFLALGPPDMTGDGPNAASENAAEASAPADDTDGTAGAPAESAAETLGDVLEDAADAATGAFAPDTETPGDGTGDAAGTMEDGVSAPIDAATGLGSDGEAGGAGVSDTMGPAANETLDEASGAGSGPDTFPNAAPGSGDETGFDASGHGPAPEDDLAAILSPQGFDHEAAVAAVEASGLSALGKRAARTALEEAREFPEVRDEALARVRRLLGVE